METAIPGTGAFLHILFIFVNLYLVPFVRDDVFFILFLMTIVCVAIA